MAQAADLAQVGSDTRTNAVDAVAAFAIPFAGKDRLAICGITSGRSSAARLRAKKLDDGRRLRLGKIAWRHRRVWNPAQHDADELGIGRRAAELAMTEIDTRHDVPFGTVALGAVFHVQLLAVRWRTWRSHVWSDRRLRERQRRRSADENDSQHKLAPFGHILRDNPARRTSSMPATKFAPAFALCLLLGPTAA